MLMQLMLACCVAGALTVTLQVHWASRRLDIEKEPLANPARLDPPPKPRRPARPLKMSKQSKHTQSQGYEKGKRAWTTGC